MGRKPAFTDYDVIEAVKKLQNQKKTINGTNLRLSIGLGSPKKLIETYLELVAKGKIKSEKNTEIEALELQLEAQLELLSQKEDEVVKLNSEVTSLMAISLNILNMIPIEVDFEENVLSSFERVDESGIGYQVIYKALKDNSLLKSQYRTKLLDLEEIQKEKADIEERAFTAGNKNDFNSLKLLEKKFIDLKNELTKLEVKITARF